MKGNCRVSRNEQTCVSGQRYDSTLQRVRKHIFSQNGVAPRIIRPRQYFLILPGLFVFSRCCFLCYHRSISVEQAIEKTKPYAVDASSAVEANGFKDYEKIKAFIERVRNE